MNKHLSTYYADPPNEGQYCEVHFDFKEEYENTNQTEETITDKPLENLKDGEFTEENFKPLE